YINTIAQMCKKYGVPFHTDAAQAIGSVHIDVKEMNIDALSMSGHKVYGPKGVGALYIRNGLEVTRFVTGGHQERKRRGGTSNVPAIVGFGNAVEITMRDSKLNNARLKSMRDYMIREIEDKFEFVYLNGHRTQRLPNNVNFSFSGISGESMLMTLDMDGIAVGTGSACASGSIDRSHALDAMGIEAELNRSAIRFTLTRSTTKEDIDYVVNKLLGIVKKLRSLSGVSVFKKGV
ncbi:MAG: aminotransferase class V-fold PLP-dependent enzyme, partial [Firmicutes bacterium]|nr:aminotransferase class V-fold PLP-dependent enzyme [Bacillota bacterium]